MQNKARGIVNGYVADRIAEIRRSRRMTVEDAAKKAGLPPGSYACLENGWYRINLDTLFRMLFAVGAKLEQVWPESDEVLERSA